MSSTKRCAATTQLGKRCKNPVTKNGNKSNNFCPIHNKNKKKTKKKITKTTRKKTTQKGKRITFSIANESEEENENDSRVELESEHEGEDEKAFSKLNVSELASQFAEGCNMRVALHSLMSDHTYRTYNFMKSWALRDKVKNKVELDVAQKYLLENQDEIGAAFAPVYDANVQKLVSKLFREHIVLAIPVLEAAEKKDINKLKTAKTNWRKNATQIAEALHSLNPTFDLWATKLLESALFQHLDHVEAYSGAFVQGKFQESISKLEISRKHMLTFADVLCRGLSNKLETKK